MPLHDCIQHHLYWATQRLVPPEYQVSQLNGNVHAMAWLLARGSVEISYAGEMPVRYQPGQWIFHKAVEGRQSFDGGTELISIRFDILHPYGLPLFQREDTIVVDATKTPRLAENAREMVSILDAYRNCRELSVPHRELAPQDYFRVEAAFCAWIAEYMGVMLAQGQTPTSGTIEDPRVRQVLEMLNRHNMSTKLVEPEIARACGLSLNRLNELFRRELGQTIGGFYAQRRLRLARMALLDTRKQVKEIAYELGFGTAAHFSNWFAKHQHCSPNEYRRQQPGGTIRIRPTKPGK